MLPPLPPRHLVLEAFREEILPTFIATTAILGHSLWLSGRKNSLLATGYALMAGLIAGNAFRGLIPLKPEKATWHYLLWIALGMTLLGTALRTVKLRFDVLLLFKVVLATIASWFLVPAEYQENHQWVLEVFAVTVVLEWLTLERVCSRVNGFAIPLGVSMAFGGASIILLYAHSGLFSDIATVLAVSLFGIACLAMFADIDCGGIAPAMAVLLPGLLLAAHYETYSEVELKSFLLVALSPLAWLLILIWPLNRIRNHWIQLILSQLFILIPVVLAVIFAMQAEELDFG